MAGDATASIYEAALAHHQAGHLREADALYRQILAANPAHVASLQMLAVLAHQIGRSDAATELLRRALALAPDSAEAHNNLGVALDATGDTAGAIDAYRRAVALRPAFPSAWQNLGLALRARRDLGQAAAAFARSAELQPDQAAAHAELGQTLFQMGELDKAAAALSRAVALDPSLVECHNNLGNIEKERGCIDDALRRYRDALAVRPESWLMSNLLYTLSFHSTLSGREILAEHLRWNQQFAEPLAPPRRPMVRDPAPDRRLRIGYVSAHLRRHPVGRFLLPLLAHHDHSRFEIVCYNGSAQRDAVTEQLQRDADIWKDVATLSDAQLAEAIAADGIDILVDLAMHMSGSRLLAFARRPAPVQVTYLAYCGTTGLGTIDYRLSDPFLDPPGFDESVYSEKTIRLKSYWCYDPPPEAPPAAPLPAAANGYVTFGCLNNFAKVSEAALDAWAAILQHTPQSRLLLHASRGSHRDRVLAHLASRGADPARVGFVDLIPFEQYLATFNRIDVALDPFTHAGGTTTCDGLWMGVPAVTLAGLTAVSRAGVSILSNAGLPELIATNAEDYIRLATTLAADTDRLASLRAGLRDRMRRSSLMDAPGFAGDVEAAYRVMWRAATLSS